MSTSPQTAVSSPREEGPEGAREIGNHCASLTDTDSGGPPTGASIDSPGLLTLSEASSGQPLADQAGNPDHSSLPELPPEVTEARATEVQEGDRQDSAEGSAPTAQSTETESTGPAADASAISGEGELHDGMEHFQRLRRRLLVSTLLASASAFPLCWLLFDRPAALSLLVGAVAGLLYLVLLARSVARLGGERRSVSKVQLLVPVVLVLASSRVPQLELVPALVGFLLYKPALLIQAYLDR